MDRSVRQALTSMLLCLMLLLAACGGEAIPSPEPELTGPATEAASIEVGPTHTPVEGQTGVTTEPPPDAGEEEAASAFQLHSPAFADGDPIPPRFTCDGEDQSPPLEWTEPSAGTQSLVLIADDPDAPGGTWVHWLLFNIPSGRTSLAAGIPPQPILDDGSRHGANSWGRADYGGPCPPSGAHRYVFKLYALDSQLDVEPGASKSDLLQAMDGHILAQTELLGTYSR